MTERNERVEALLRTFVVEKYREDHADDGHRGPECADHLPHCPDISVASLDAYNSAYGCDTGCDYVRFEADLSCPHGGETDFEWGDFGEINDIIDELTALDDRTQGAAR